MNIQVKCSVCNEIIGYVQKNEITQEDRELYQVSTTCSNNHENAVELIEVV